MSGTCRDIAYVNEEYPKYPDFHKRLIFEYVGRDENVRRRIEHEMRYEDVPVTCTVCNGKYHGLRTLVSMWPNKFNEIKDRYSYLYEATLAPRLDGSKYNETPREPKYSMQVLEHMREGSIHYSLDELRLHCPLSFIFLGSVKNVAWMYNSIQRCNEGNIFFNYTHVNDLEIVVTSTINGWLRFLSDQRALLRATGRENELFDYINCIVHRFYRSTSQSISLPDGFEPDKQWR